MRPEREHDDAGYNTAGQLASVVDTLNRTNSVAYNLSGEIASVTDFRGGR